MTDKLDKLFSEFKEYHDKISEDQDSLISEKKAEENENRTTFEQDYNSTFYTIIHPAISRILEVASKHGFVAKWTICYDKKLMGKDPISFMIGYYKAKKEYSMTIYPDTKTMKVVFESVIDKGFTYSDQIRENDLADINSQFIEDLIAEDISKMLTDFNPYK